MEKRVIKLEPIFKERIWGGQRIKEEFFAETEIDPVGEMWVVAALRGNGDNYISQLGLTLSELYEKYPDWFKCDTKELPIRCTIIDPKSDLSVQVHPQDEYAWKHHQSFGKPEAWYVMDSKPGAKILYGHTAQNREQLRDFVYNKKWNELLSYVDAKEQGFIMIDAGEVHALGKDILCFEISRAADLTYRLYDYDRRDQKTGELRELHIEPSLDVITVPHEGEGIVLGDTLVFDQYKLTTFIDEPGVFTLKKIETLKDTRFENNRFYFLTVINGQGTIENNQVRKGDTLLVPDNYGVVKVSQNLEVIFSSYKNK